MLEIESIAILPMIELCSNQASKRRTNFGIFDVILQQAAQVQVNIAIVSENAIQCTMNTESSTLQALPIHLAQRFDFGGGHQSFKIFPTMNLVAMAQLNVVNVRRDTVITAPIDVDGQ